jgi:hypothetical protein
MLVLCFAALNLNENLLVSFGLLEYGEQLD